MLGSLWNSNSMTYRVTLDDELVAKLYLQGESALKISKMFSVSNATIANHLKKYGIKIRQYDWSLEELNFLKENYNKLNMKDLSKKLNRTTQAISIKSSRLGLKLTRPRFKRFNWAFINDNPYDKLITKEDLAYIAGIFDGEGSLSKVVTNWTMKITNTYKPLIDYLVRKIPYSKSYNCDEHKNNDKYKIKYNWTLFGNCRIRALLVLLLPYLKIKYSKAQEMIAFTDEWFKNALS